jgi:hypothetical protein
MQRSSRSALASLATVVLALTASNAGVARADEKAACVAASDQAQSLRDEGKYRTARASLVECARDACPGIVRRDCEKWLTDLDAAQPTVVFGARDPKGNDVTGTHVLIDGTPLLDHLDGKPTAVDPGEHVFRYEAPGAVFVEQRVVVRVNEKNRVLTAILMPQSTPAVAQPPVAPPAPPADVAPVDTGAQRAGVPVATWVFLGVTAVGGAGFAYFGLSGQSDVANMRASGGCAPNCPESQVDSARTKLNIADVSLGVGVVSLGLAAYFFFTRGDAPRSAAALNVLPDVEARPGGGVATIRARF